LFYNITGVEQNAEEMEVEEAPKKKKKKSKNADE
jgi:hypothetical protein